MVFPITATPPSYMVIVRSKTRQSNVYYKTETGRSIDLLAWSSNGNAQAAKQAFTGNYYIRDYYGQQVATGSLSASTSVPIPDDLPCGGYRIHLTQSVNDPVYGFAGGTGSMVVINTDARFPSMVGVTPTNEGRRGTLGDDCYMHGVTMQGPRRDAVGDPTNPLYIQTMQQSAALDNNWYLSNPDPARAREKFLLNVNVLNSTNEAAWQTLVGQAYDTCGITWFEGPGNEPAGNAATHATQIANFSALTKAARPGAKVMGPCTVNINGQYNPPLPAAGYYNSFFGWIKAQNPMPIDGVSFHPYNSINGDLSLGRKCYGTLRDTMAANGLQNLPLWDTEQGYFATYYGTFMPRMQGRWTMLMFLIEEQFGLPKERHAIFYDTATGDYSFPSQYGSGDALWFPATAMLRAYSAELWGKTFDQAIDFGTPGNDMLIGNVYADQSTGAKTMAFQTAGSTDLSVTLSVTGAATLTVVDCFGNTSTVPVSGGKATVPLKIEPVYVRVPAGVTTSVVHEWNAAALGTELAASCTPTASGSAGNVSTNAARMVDGNQLSTYYLSAGITARNQTNAPYVDDTNAFPAWAKFTWATPQTLDRLVVFATPPWQAQGTLLDFDVQYLAGDGATWITQATINEPVRYGTPADATANVIGQVSHALQSGCTVESFFSERWVFPVKFGSKVTTTAVRLNIRAATYGMSPTPEVATASGSAAATTFGSNFTIRSVQAFNSATVAAPAAGNPYVVRTIT